MKYLLILFLLVSCGQSNDDLEIIETPDKLVIVNHDNDQTTIVDKKSKYQRCIEHLSPRGYLTMWQIEQICSRSNSKY